MIARRDDPSDARKSLLTLSAKGKKVVSGRTNAGEAAIKRVLAKMPGKLEAARELLSAVAEELELLGR